MLNGNRKNIPVARMLRKNLTPEEKHLWFDFLKEFPIRFRRQERIGNYIADFFCSKAGLVVELDGKWHNEDEALEYDAKRNVFLESLGLIVLRFENVDIHVNFAGVCNTISDTVEARIRQKD